jgi:hypothetical protein
MEMVVHRELVMALGPLSAALSRQDNLLLERTPPLQLPLAELKELLMEVLETVQPSQQELLRQELGISGSTARR